MKLLYNILSTCTLNICNDCQYIHIPAHVDIKFGTLKHFTFRFTCILNHEVHVHVYDLLNRLNDFKMQHLFTSVILAVDQIVFIKFMYM